MMKFVKYFSLLSGIFIVISSLHADEKAVRASLGDVVPDQVRPAAMEGLYEVVVGPHVVYMSADGKYMIQGDLVDVASQKNLTEPARLAAQSKAIESIGESNMLIYSPEKTSHTITVFTDIDCGYCRKLHQEMKQLNGKGIRVRYMMYPRAGVESHSYEKAVSVWCADNPREAMTSAKTGAEPVAKQCDNPVKQHMAMAEMMGVRGTPTIILEDGRLIPGYVPAERLAALLDMPTEK